MTRAVGTEEFNVTFTSTPEAITGRAQPCDEQKILSKIFPLYQNLTFWNTVFTISNNMTSSFAKICKSGSVVKLMNESKYTSSSST